MMHFLKFATDHTTNYNYQAPSSNAFSLVLPILTVFLVLVFEVIALVGIWKTFTKAGKPGWGSLVPIYNNYLLTQIAERPGWWTVLFFVPIVSVVISAIVSVDIAKRFGKSTMFGIVALWLFSGVGYLIIGLGEAEYKSQTPVAADTVTNPPDSPADKA